MRGALLALLALAGTNGFMPGGGPILGPHGGGLSGRNARIQGSRKPVCGEACGDRLRAHGLRGARATLGREGEVNLEAPVHGGRPLVPPKVGSVAWRDDYPQRQERVGKGSWLNQFPNTWEPAEALLLDKPARSPPADKITTGGVEFTAASSTKVYDACVIGTGPAGLALAAALGAPRAPPSAAATPAAH